ncbi:hypothetical protein V7654_21230 [Bacillus sp. JJ1609]|uniref:hypothetical protein n=1 Tax=Bacillus sp. JJ1609 TaxID=3122977 RepID=UPI00300095F2
MISTPGCSLSAGRAVSLLGYRSCGGSTVPLIPLESRTSHSNQLIYQSFAFKQSFRKQPFFKKKMKFKQDKSSSGNKCIGFEYFRKIFNFHDAFVSLVFVYQRKSSGITRTGKSPSFFPAVL